MGAQPVAPPAERVDSDRRGRLAFTERWLAAEGPGRSNRLPGHHIGRNCREWQNDNKPPSPCEAQGGRTVSKLLTGTS